MKIEMVINILKTLPRDILFDSLLLVDENSLKDAAIYGLHTANQQKLVSDAAQVRAADEEELDEEVKVELEPYKSRFRGGPCNFGKSLHAGKALNLLNNPGRSIVDQEGNQYVSIRDAAKKTGIPKSTIADAIAGRRSITVTKPSGAKVFTFSLVNPKTPLKPKQEPYQSGKVDFE